MPDFTIDGNPSAIRSRATTTYDKGQLFFDTGNALSAIDTDGWIGRAADHFRDAHKLEPERWFAAGNGFRTAGTALQAYATAVEQAQKVAEWAQGEYDRGDEVTQSARSSYDADVSDARQKLAAGVYSSLTIEPFHDPGQAIRDNAVSEFNQAKATLEEAAQTCAGQVRAGCADAPEEPHWWESGLKFVGGIFQGAGEAVWDLLTISPFGAVNMITDSWKLATGDLTPEELMKKYELSLETVGDMWQALQDDPVEFGKNLGKGLLDWDTWADDPARAIGHLVPDAVAAVATAGTGTVATRGVKGGADAMEALADMARMSRLSHLDDVGDLGRLGRLDGLDNLDELTDLGRTYSMMDDVPHTTTYAPEQLGDSRVLDDLLDDTGLTRDEFSDLANKPLSDLTPAERDTLTSVRDSLPAPDADTVMQKVIPPPRFDEAGNLVPSAADNYVLGNQPGFNVDEVRGAVTVADDTSHLTTPQQIHDGLRLDYDHTPYAPDDASTHVIRFQSENPDFEVPRHSDMGGSGGFDNWGDPFTGNGFTKADGDIIPEYAVPDGQTVTMRDGAEMWEVTDTGTQRLVAVLRDGEWIPQGN
jgi:type VII secretion system ESX-1 substrate